MVDLDMELSKVTVENRLNILTLSLYSMERIQEGLETIENKLALLIRFYEEDTTND